jgi:hypothetical protein
MTTHVVLSRPGYPACAASRVLLLACPFTD